MCNVHSSRLLVPDLRRFIRFRYKLLLSVVGFDFRHTGSVNSAAELLLSKHRVKIKQDEVIGDRYMVSYIGT